MTFDHLDASVQIEPGLSDFYIGIVSEFTSIAKPTAPFANKGDEVRIQTAHVPKTNCGFYRVYQVKKRHQGKGDPAGAFGAKTLVHEYEVFVPGVDPITTEFVKNIINKEVFTLHRDSDCANPQVIQLGDECRPAEIDANYTTGTIEPSGEKGYILKVKWVGIQKFYEAAIPLDVTPVS